MSIEIEEEDFIPGKQYSEETVAQMLETMKPTLKDNVFLLNRMEVGETNIYGCPSIGVYNQNTLPEYITQSKILDNNGKSDEDFTLAGVINLEGEHYVSAIFSANDGINTLVLHDPLGSPGKFAAGFEQYTDQIKDSFEQQFGEITTAEINPKNNSLYQKDITSCGPISAYTLEHVLKEKNFEENPKIGLTKTQNGELKFEESTNLLRQDQHKKLNEFKMIEEFMKDKEEISAAELVDNIFTNQNYDEKTKNTLLNNLMDKGLIEGQENLSKKDILKALDIKEQEKPELQTHLPKHQDKKITGNLTPDHTPKNLDTNKSLKGPTL